MLQNSLSLEGQLANVNNKPVQSTHISAKSLHVFIYSIYDSHSFCLSAVTVVIAPLVYTRFHSLLSAAE